MQALNRMLAAGVEAIIAAGWLPLANVFIEPGKIFFLNNAINHGILSPLGMKQAAETGRSILFLLETNPGPGLGVLLAYWLFGKGMAKQSAPGAAIIHFLGGIHEIYFPYILMKPLLILAVIAGGVSGVFTFSLFDAGLVAVPSPGSLFALLAMTPKGNYPGMLLGVAVGTTVSFLAALLLLKRSKGEATEEDMMKATEKLGQLKGAKSTAAEALIPSGQKQVRKIVFACDAGMGSSAMGASILRRKVQEAGLEMDVVNTSIRELPPDADIVITHKDLTEQAKARLPQADHVSVENFLSSPKYDELVEGLKRNEKKT